MPARAPLHDVQQLPCEPPQIKERTREVDQPVDNSETNDGEKNDKVPVANHYNFSYIVSFSDGPVLLPIAMLDMLRWFFYIWSDVLIFTVARSMLVL
jgi:hypothetical protein